MEFQNYEQSDATSTAVQQLLKNETWLLWPKGEGRHHLALGRPPHFFNVNSKLSMLLKGSCHNVDTLK